MMKIVQHSKMEEFKLRIFLNKWISIRIGRVKKNSVEFVQSYDILFILLQQQSVFFGIF